MDAFIPDSLARGRTLIALRSLRGTEIQAGISIDARNDPQLPDRSGDGLVGCQFHVRLPGTDDRETDLEAIGSDGLWIADFREFVAKLDQLLAGSVPAVALRTYTGKVLFSIEGLSRPPNSFLVYGQIENINKRANEWRERAIIDVSESTNLYSIQFAFLTDRDRILHFQRNVFDFLEILAIVMESTENS